MVLFLLLVLVAIALGIIGTVTEGLGYLLLIGVALFVAALAFIVMRWSRRSSRHPIR